MSDNAKNYPYYEEVRRRVQAAYSVPATTRRKKLFRLPGDIHWQPSAYKQPARSVVWVEESIGVGGGIFVAQLPGERQTLLEQRIIRGLILLRNKEELSHVYE